MLDWSHPDRNFDEPRNHPIL